MEHPITPPPELVQRLRNEAPHGIRDAGVTRELCLIAAAYRAGADQELEACEQWVEANFGQLPAHNLHQFRRPKPPSLKKQALKALEHLALIPDPPGFIADMDTIRRALEQLNE